MQPNTCATRKLQKDMEEHILKPGQKPLSDERQSVLWPALEIGGVSGMSGLLFGAVTGILRSTRPTVFALASGIQWFTLGSTYWAAKSSLLNSLGGDKIKSSYIISASSIAGGIAGCAGSLLRGRRNLVSDAIVFGLLGGAGQAVYNLAHAQHDVHPISPTKSGTKSETRSGSQDSKWSLVKALSDEEYEGILREKMLQLEAEIALVDENIVNLKNQATENTAKQRKTDKENNYRTY